MKIAITGAAGNAGVAVVALLHSAGHDLQLGDASAPSEAIRGIGRYFRCDTRTPADVDALIDGADAVIHLAAWHCAHHPPVSDETIFAVNVDGTFNVVQSCRKFKTKSLVFASSMAFGYGGIYSVTKVIGEDLTRSFHEITKSPVVNLRYHEFLPCPYLRYGQKLLYNGVDRRDVATATVAAVEAAAAGKIERFTTVVHHHLGAPPAVIAAFAKLGGEWLESAVPGAGRLLEKYGLVLPEHVEQHNMAEAAAKLGWSPKYNFVTFLKDLDRRDRAGEDVAKLMTTGELP